MKKIILSITLVVALFLSMTVPTVAATSLPIPSQIDNDTTVIYYEDGSKLTISSAITEEAYCTAALTETITKSSKKEARFEDSDGNIEWLYTLYATFSYETGVSAVCTDTYYTQTIYEGNWTFSNGAATKSGATAKGSGNYIKKVLFITIRDIDIDISLTCDKYGNVT